MNSPLSGIRVLDLTRLLPGAFCTMILADLGAEVVKIEEPYVGDPIRHMPPLFNGVSIYHIILNRNKKSISLNLKNDVERKAFLKLAGEADVVVEGFRPGVAGRLGIDYDTVKSINPKIIYCSITGYGQSGVYAYRAGHDLNYISLAGILSVSQKTFEEIPAIPPVQIADLSGGVTASLSILAALIQRGRTGSGAYIDISMTDTSLFWNIINVATCIALGKQPSEEDLTLTGGYGCYRIYRTSDDKYVSVAALENKFWSSLCRALGLDSLASKQYSREDRSKVVNEMKEIFKSKKRDEWLKILEGVDTCIAPVLDVFEALNSIYFKERGLIVEANHPRAGRVKVILSPIRINGLLPSPHLHAPELGEHNSEFLHNPPET
jgi:crotonobetainyl-CoA:carnitine CoA-transferase CaiB-like acyl-CoA transferase